MAVLRTPCTRIVERCDGRGETVAEEQPAPADPAGGEVSAACEVVDCGAWYAQQLGDLSG